MGRSIQDISLCSELFGSAGHIRRLPVHIVFEGPENPTPVA